MIGTLLTSPNSPLPTLPHRPGPETAPNCAKLHPHRPQAIELSFRCLEGYLSSHAVGLHLFTMSSKRSPQRLTQSKTGPMPLFISNHLICFMYNMYYPCSYFIFLALYLACSQSYPWHIAQSLGLSKYWLMERIPVCLYVVLYVLGV